MIVQYCKGQAAKVHYENLGSSWMLGGSLPDSNKLLRIVPTYANCTIENKKTLKPLARS